MTSAATDSNSSQCSNGAGHGCVKPFVRAVRPLSNREKQRRWYEKMKTDPARYAAFKRKYNAAVMTRYHADRADPAKVERDRATRRKAGRKQWQKIARDPSRREKHRINSNLRCVELRDKYVAARLKLTPEACPRELLELKRAHLQLKREIRKQYGPK